MSLPELFPFTGDWESYVEDLYRIYCDEIVNANLTFQGRRISCQYRPESNGKHFGFWHVVSDGKVEEERIPDMRRCECIRWIPWIIRNASDKKVSCWENQRGTNTHVVLWLEEHDFCVILSKRYDYFLLKTAYTVAGHRKKTFLKERAEFWEA